MTQTLTKAHHQLVSQFVGFKERTEEKMKKADQAIKEMSMLEVALAQKTPVMEAEFAMDDRTSLNLFDCLVPKLREHRRFRIQKDAVFSIADFKE